MKQLLVTIAASGTTALFRNQQLSSQPHGLAPRGPQGTARGERGVSPGQRRGKPGPDRIESEVVAGGVVLLLCV